MFVTILSSDRKHWERGCVSASALVCQFDNLVLGRLRTCRNLITWKKLAGIDPHFYVHRNKHLSDLAETKGGLQVFPLFLYASENF